MTDELPPRKHEQPVTAKTVVLGVLATAGMHIVVAYQAAGAAAILDAGGVGDAAAAFLFPLFFIGLAQLVYLGPAWWISRRAKWHGFALGLVIGASLTFLVNTACFGMLFFGGLY